MIVPNFISLQVEFQDQSQLLLKHSEIYSLQHELPKRVRARLVSIMACFPV